MFFKLTDLEALRQVKYCLSACRIFNQFDESNLLTEIGDGVQDKPSNYEYRTNL